MLFRALLSFLLSLNLGIWQTGAWAIAEDVRDGDQPAVQYPPRPHDTLNRSFFPITNDSPPAPFYMIAHRVVDKKGVLAALQHGANSIEIELTPVDGGWLADPDEPTSLADNLIPIIAEQRQSGEKITFVWLRLKTPDRCDPTGQMRRCSVEALRDLVSKHLSSVEVRTLYGFPKNTGQAFNIVRGKLKPGEAINLDGQENEVGPQLESIPRDHTKKVMSFGNSDFASNLGDCYESRHKICTELRMGVEKKSDRYGKVFGWTSTGGQGHEVRKLLSETGIDGLMYGFKDKPYSDDSTTKEAADDIVKAVRDHSSKWNLAKRNDAPW